MENHESFIYDNYQFMSSLDQYGQYSLDDEIMSFQSFSSERYNTISSQIDLIPNQQISPSAKQEIIKSSKASSSSSSRLISFENSNSEPKRELGSEGPYHENVNFKPSINNCQTPNSLPNYYEQGVMMVKGVGSTHRSALYSHSEHVLAERKRREKLSQRFLALSAVIPGLKKSERELRYWKNKKPSQTDVDTDSDSQWPEMDKATVLGDAIKYVKQLEERVKLLEQQTLQRTVESVVFVMRSSSSLLSSSQLISTLDLTSDERFNQTLTLPEVEARVSDKDILIRIHCEKRKAMSLSDILAEIEKLQLTIVNSNVLPLGSSTIDVTIVAKMDDEFCMEVKDLVKSLREALLNYFNI